MTAALLAILLLLPASPQDQAKPLPDLQAIKGDLRTVMSTFMNTAETIQDNTRPSEVLKEYVYTERETRIALDSKGSPTKTETNVYQVIQGLEGWQFYRKQISKDGVPLTAKELEKQDREQARQEQKGREESARAAREAQKNKSPQAPQAPTPAVSPERLKELMDNGSFIYFSTIYDIRIVRREVLDGHDTLVLTFKPKPNVKTKDSFLKMMQHIAIQAWVSEQEHEVAKLEVEVVDTISFGFGLLAKFQKGSRLLLERRIISGGLWAPVKVEATVSARVLVVKGLNQRQISEYSDFKKYTVETILKAGEPVEARNP